MIQQGKVRFFIPPDLIEQDALTQVFNTASMPFVHAVAVMPDVHYGMGSTVGTVVATQGAVMPACVGVDIGCGMIAVETSLTLKDIWPHKRAILEGIERRIPVGVGNFGVNSRILDSASPRVAELEALAARFFDDPDYMSRHDKGVWRRALGSLGGGNHFIEVCALDSDWIEAGPDEGDMPIWVILHSGSRGIGNKTGTHWTRIAKAQPKHYMQGVQIPDPNLSALIAGTAEYAQYGMELRWCQHFALLNREEMMDRVLTELWYQCHVLPSGLNPKTEHPELAARNFLEVSRVNSHHNYTSEEVHEGMQLTITRKGAISALPGQRALIPGSMGTNSYIVEGLGNPFSFNSAPHGAGRRMSRTKAKQTFTVEQVALQLAARGIEARMREAIVDEAPGSYKDIEETMRHAADLVRPVVSLRQIINVKGD